MNRSLQKFKKNSRSNIKVQNIESIESIESMESIESIESITSIQYYKYDFISHNLTIVTIW